MSVSGLDPQEFDLTDLRRAWYSSPVFCSPVIAALYQEAAQYLPKRLFKENAPFIFFVLMGPFARTLFARTLLPVPILCYSGEILPAKMLEHLVWSNTSGFQFRGLLLEQTFLLALCGLPIIGCTRRVPYSAKGCFLPSKHLLNAFYNSGK